MGIDGENDDNDIKILDGPWTEDLIKYPKNSYEFEKDGYKCKIARNSHTKTWCGYVTLPETHPFGCLAYGDIDNIIQVHGDLTFGDGDGTFGFDCLHMLMGDISPVYESLAKDPIHGEMFKSDHLGLFKYKPHYWTYEEVYEEVLSMVKQFQKYE